MRAPIMAGATGGTVVRSGFGRFSRAHPVLGRSDLRSRYRSIAEWWGRAALALPSSVWLFGDVCILAAGIVVAYQQFPPVHLPPTPHIAMWKAVGIFSFLAAVFSMVFGLNERETLQSRSRILTRMLLTVGAITAGAYAIIYVVMYATISRRATGLAMSMLLLGGIGTRFAAWWAIRQVNRQLLVVGPGSLYESFERAQAIGCLPEYRLVGYASVDEVDGQAVGRGSYVGPIAEYVAGLDSARVTDVVVGQEATRDPRVMDWVVPCLQRGCRVTNEATFYEKATGQILVDEITPQWFLFADLKVHCDQQAVVKRLVDVVGAVLGLCLTMPLWPLIAMAVKLCDGGPVFYAQTRVGQNGHEFRLFKFRTMRVDAERGKSVWSSPNDPRVTRVGRLLRRTRLDELPQLFNVLIGQMSIVGPRPERPDIVRELCDNLPYYAERHLVKPGITGWAQISFRYGLSIEDARRKLQFDLYYLKHMSLELDLVILLRTFGTFLRGAC